MARYGQHRVFRTVGTLRAIWLIGLAFVRPGVVGLLTVMAVELAIIINMSLYNSVFATYRLEHTPRPQPTANRSTRFSPVPATPDQYASTASPARGG